MTLTSSMAALLHVALQDLRSGKALLVERLPSIRLVGDPPEWHDSLILRGVKALPVEDWDKPGPDGRTMPEKRIYWADPAILIR